MQTKISSIEISSFTVFEHNTIQFSPGLNVFIGKNGTGKTHLLKVLYSFVKGESLSNGVRTSMFPAKLGAVFKIIELARYVRKNSNKAKSILRIFYSNQDSVEMTFGVVGLNYEAKIKDPKKIPESLYIPPQEMLSLFDGFIASWEKRENSFDETYYDLAKALSLSPLKDTKLLNDLLNPLESILKAKVIRESGRFYLEYQWGKVEAHLVAEGLRKLSQIIYLIGNGSINENTILFWDEPEVHFNPSLIEAIVILLRNLIGKGIQIFITTHDYLLSQRLSLLAEYEEKIFPVKFFCFSNENEGGVKIEEGNTLIDIDSNPILNEFADYYDFERNLFKNSPNTHK